MCARVCVCTLAQILRCYSTTPFHFSQHQSSPLPQPPQDNRHPHGLLAWIRCVLSPHIVPSSLKSRTIPGECCLPYIYIHTQLLYFLLWLAFLYEDEIPPISGWNVSWHTFLIRVMWRKQSRCYYLPFFSIGHPARAMVSAGPTEREESRPGQLWWESRIHLPTHGLSDLGEVTKCSGSSLLKDGDDGNYCTELFLKWYII